MARAPRDSRLETRSARVRLRAGLRYWREVGKGLALGYRRTKGGYGTWSLRVLLPDGRYKLKALGMADDTQDPNGADVLSYYEAQARCRELADDKRKVAGLIRGPLTVQQAAERYLEWFEKNRASYAYTQHRVQLHVLPAFGDKLVEELTRLEIATWHENMAAQKPQKRAAAGKTAYRDWTRTADSVRARRATANRVLSILKAILNKAFRDELVSDDTAWRLVAPFEKVDQVSIRFLSEAEAIRLINGADKDFRPLVKAALFTGARYGELVNLRVSGVHLKNNRVYVQGGKTGDGRYIPLSTEGADLLRSQVAGKSSDDLVFTREGGGQWGTAHQLRRMKDASRKAKIQPAATFYDLRHTFASLLKHSGADLMYVSKLLGHADMRMTIKHYAGLFDDTLEKTVNAHLPSFGHKPERSKVRNIHT